MDNDSEQIEVFADGHMNIYARVSKNNPKNQPCPKCHRENVLTPKDVAGKNICRVCNKEMLKEQKKMLKQWEKEDKKAGLSGN